MILENTHLVTIQVTLHINPNIYKNLAYFTYDNLQDGTSGSRKSTKKIPIENVDNTI